MKKASGRSGSDRRPIEKYPKAVATMAPASRPVDSSYHRRPIANVASARPMPASAGPEPRLGFADPERRKRAGDEPVEEDRLLKPGFVVVVRRQPVAELDHLAAGFGVERFVGVPDRRPAQARQERDDDSSTRSRIERRTKHDCILLQGECAADVSPRRRHRRLDRSPEVRQQGRRAFASQGYDVVPVNPHEASD